MDDADDFCRRIGEDVGGGDGRVLGSKIFVNV